MDTQQMDTQQMDTQQITTKALCVGFIVLASLCFSLSALASSSPVASDIFACDTCDYEKAEWVVAQELNAPECVFTNPPGTVATPEDAWCSAVTKIVIVANPLTEEAWKFRTRHSCSDGSCNYGNPVVQQLTISGDESEAVTTFFEYHKLVQDAVHSAQGIQHDFFNSTNGFLQTGTAPNLTISSDIAQDCSMSPVQYFINPSFRQEIYDAMADVLSNHIGDARFQDLISSRQTTSRGFGVNLRQGVNVSVSFEYLEYDLHHVISFGDSSRDRLMFKVDYHGNAMVGGVDPLYLDFSLRRSASVVEGRPLEGITGDGAGVNLTHDDIGCLSELLNDPSLGTTIGISEPLINVPPAWEGLGYDLCERQTELQTCSTYMGSEQCSTSIIRDIVPCG